VDLSFVFLSALAIPFSQYFYDSLGKGAKDVKIKCPGFNPAGRVK